MLRRHPLADAAETDSDDLELLRRIQNGDREALESVVRHQQDWIYNIALRMVYLPEDAEDATQDSDQAADQAVSASHGRGGPVNNVVSSTKQSGLPDGSSV
jgi:hypothetical protein